MPKGDVGMFAGLRPKAIIGATIGCSIILFGAYFGYTKFLVDLPLVEQVETIQQVELVEFDAQEKILKVKITDKTNLPQTYQQLLKVLGSTGYQLEIVNNPSETLQSYFYRAQFVIQEAMITGKYQEMLLRLEEMAAQEELVANFYLDENYLYVDLADGAYDLVTVIPRTPGARDVNRHD